LVRLTDNEIENLLQEKKMLPANFTSKIRLRAKGSHSEQQFDFQGEHGRQYRLILRQNRVNPLDFSVILAYCPPETNQLFRLCRYNGKSHWHTNRLEKSSFFGFHIHKATARYQDLGAAEDSFAEPTSNYADFQGALSCLISDCSFVSESDKHPSLFS